MKFERVSFRTTEKERQLLVKLNQRYKCRTVTSFMHKLLQEIDDKHLLVDHTETPKVSDMFGDFDFDLTSVKGQTAESEKPKTPNPTLEAQNETDPFYRELERMRMASNREKEEKRPTLTEQLIKEFEDLERFRDALNRSLPSARKPLS